MGALREAETRHTRGLSHHAGNATRDVVTVRRICAGMRSCGGDLCIYWASLSGLGHCTCLMFACDLRARHGVSVPLLAWSLFRLGSAKGARRPLGVAPRRAEGPGDEC